MGSYHLWIVVTVASVATLPFYRFPGGLSIPLCLALFPVLPFLLIRATTTIILPRGLKLLAGGVGCFALTYGFVLAVNTVVFQQVSSFIWLLELGSYILVAMILLVAITNGPGFVRLALRTLTTVGVGLAVFGLWRFLSGTGAWVELVDHTNEQGFGTRNSDMFLIWPAAPFLFASVVSRRSRLLTRCIALVLAIAVLVALILSASRGAVVIGLISSVASFYLLSTITQKVSVSLLIVIGGVVAIAFYGDLIFELLQGLTIADRIIQRLDAGENRLELLVIALRAIAEAPLLGHGTESAEYMAATLDEVHFHSSILQIAVEAGVPAAFSFMCVLAAPIIIGLSRCSAKGRFSDEVAIGTALALGIFIQCLISIFYNWVYFWFAWSIACAAVSKPIDTAARATKVYSRDVEVFA